ncbi:hypothetical protein, partial [uncultured Dialister sp.]|uniref:hypothetical protein n=1 Tax=uncultured Dialister sp. TaxID=278064 RepID=UPI0025CF8614
HKNPRMKSDNDLISASLEFRVPAVKVIALSFEPDSRFAGPPPMGEAITLAPSPGELSPKASEGVHLIRRR